MTNGRDEGFEWQIGVWDRMANVYQREIDRRFGPVIERVLSRAKLRPGERILDLGTGTGAVALLACTQVGPNGHVLAVDISSEMIAIACARAEALSLGNLAFAVGRAEAIPDEDASSDAILASLSIMYVIDRAAAAREIARVLRPGGRFIGAVWAGPEEADIVLFQQTAGSFAPRPPVQGVGPGALGDPTPFLSQLASVGLAARCEKELTEFQFATFHEAWDALAGVTTAALGPEARENAKSAVRERMWPAADEPRMFRNMTNFIVGEKPA